MKIGLKIYAQKEQADLEHAVLHVEFALRMRASSKSRAFELAMAQLNERNVCLDRVRLADGFGEQAWFAVEKIDSIRWTAAESTGFSHLFKVYGHMRLEIVPDGASASSRLAVPLTAEHRLPRSKLSSMAIWVIPTATEPVFATVLRQSMEQLSRGILSGVGPS
ncbi:hypothetical protein ACF3MZ_02865 [Paenibacillaceae bacterium WGS1546]|uniref:hypothetical protein n=1 Tax=Cohnella sp. WGS1546 TaxID=3366810 RepID=UPI00372D7B61